MNRPDVNLKASLLGLLATVDLDLALIPRYGIEGVAVASATSYVVTTTFVAISLARIAGLPQLATLLPVPDDLPKPYQWTQKPSTISTRTGRSLSVSTRAIKQS